MTSSQPEISRFRTLSGRLRLLTKMLLIAIPVVGVFFIMDTPSYLGWSILIEQYYGIFLAIVLVCVFLLVPPTKGAARNRVPWYDVILSILGVGVGLYVAVLYPNILWELGIITPDRVIMSTIAVVLILEAVRRLTGWFLPSLGLLFILFARFTWLVPGVFRGPGIPWERLFNSLYLDSNALLGIPMYVTAVIVLGFILFGNLLFGVGGGAFLTNVAVAGFGRFRGGPAKIAVVASSLFGTVSGSAVSNVVTTGVMTIPLMKKTGYKPHLAAAVEATASTGGQLMPPIMGAAAFIISEYTGIPYPEVAIAAFLPAILYYVALFVQVDLEAGKAGLKGLPREQIPPLRGMLGQSYLFLIPLAALVYALFILFLAPGKAALFGVASILLISCFKGLRRWSWLFPVLLGVLVYILVGLWSAVLSMVVLSFFLRKTRYDFGWLLEALEKTGRALLELSVIVAMAGLIIGVVVFSGVGFILPLVMSQLAGGNVYLLLLIIAAVSIILGMGMPTVAVYILLAVLMAPSLIQLGVGVLAAHLFILYFGVLSMITPPICFAAFAAAAVAGADSMRTGYTSMRIGILAYPVPFLFVLFPVLLLMGSPIEIAVAVITAIFGSFLVGCAAVGYLFRGLSPQVRLLMALAGIGLLIPAQQGELYMVGLLSDIIGGGLALLMLAWEWQMRKRLKTA